MYEAVISVDKQGILNYWTGEKSDYAFPRNVDFESKLDTDLFEFMKQKTYPLNLCFSPNGELFATYGADRKVRKFYYRVVSISCVSIKSIMNRPGSDFQVCLGQAHTCHRRIHPALHGTSTEKNVAKYGV